MCQAGTFKIIVLLHDRSFSQFCLQPPDLTASSDGHWEYNVQKDMTSVSEECLVCGRQPHKGGAQNAGEAQRSMTGWGQHGGGLGWCRKESQVRGMGR